MGRGRHRSLRGQGQPYLFKKFHDTKGYIVLLCHKTRQSQTNHDLKTQNNEMRVASLSSQQFTTVRHSLLFKTTALVLDQHRGGTWHGTQQPLSAPGLSYSSKGKELSHSSSPLPQLCSPVCSVTSLLLHPQHKTTAAWRANRGTTAQTPPSTEPADPPIGPDFRAHW